MGFAYQCAFVPDNKCHLYIRPFLHGSRSNKTKIISPLLTPANTECVEVFLIFSMVQLNAIVVKYIVYVCFVYMSNVDVSECTQSCNSCALYFTKCAHSIEWKCSHLFGAWTKSLSRKWLTDRFRFVYFRHTTAMLPMSFPGWIGLVQRSLQVQCHTNRKWARHHGGALCVGLVRQINWRRGNIARWW